MGTMGTPDEVLTGDDLLRAIFASSVLGIAALGPDGRPIRVNPACERLLGYTQAELLTKRFSDFTHPDDADVSFALFEDLCAGRRDSYQFEKRYLHKDGRVVPARVTVSIHRTGGKPLIVGMVEDISANRAAEATRQDLVHTLGERVKELTALHRAAGLLLEAQGSEEDLLLQVATLLPPAMQFPDRATACVRHGDRVVTTPGHASSPWCLSAGFLTAHGKQGTIFEPFFTTKEAGKGTGLGLTVVTSVARRWQGEVTLESAVGAGTTFRVLFPKLAA